MKDISNYDDLDLEEQLDELAEIRKRIEERTERDTELIKRVNSAESEIRKRLR